jgi:hypothetical protein
MVIKRKDYSTDYLSFVSQELAALSMVPIPSGFHTSNSKLDVLRYCASYPLISEGLILEFGVHKGVSINTLAACLPDRQIDGFDSFVGFPIDGRTDWNQDFDLKGELPNVKENVRLHKGFFDVSLPRFLSSRPHDKIAFVHIDCDIYSSTRQVLDLLAPHLGPGTILVFDELIHYRGFLDNEFLALYEFVKGQGVKFEWIAMRGRVLSLTDFFDPPSNLRPLPEFMREWRALSYEQSVGLRLL